MLTCKQVLYKKAIIFLRFRVFTGKSLKLQLYLLTSKENHVSAQGLQAKT